MMTGWPLTAWMGCRVAISSPYLTERAIQDGRCDVLALIRQAMARRVEVVIYVYVAPEQNIEDGQGRNRRLKATCLRAADLLAAAGAEVVPVMRVHAETLCVDDAEIVEGSFNWLSAARDEASAYQRFEASFRYPGQYVVKVWNEWRPGGSRERLWGNLRLVLLVAPVRLIIG
ncbi:hypothetical protein [Azospirillum argentinense]|uniref:Phospholipase D-like domain-containing protein n=1 Tax=Azospirillum argentinense TaxID=2970906 RepID=A0A5B0KMQ5_9PROT|nr:hypothetical protein [Azospirillum argentinense]KAA1053225.1 hypothetical protein FH063_003144 [Azospirillum argentinense]